MQPFVGNSSANPTSKTMVKNLMSQSRRCLLATAWALFAVGTTLHAAEKARVEKPKPDYAEIKYGNHERNVLDLWKAKADKPTPLLVFIHGGGFRAGDKSQLNAELLNECLESGISVASINYRLTDTATFPAPMHDGGRAVQFLRSKAAEWNLDPKRVACSGGSAGAGISLWLAFHDDLAKPKSDDPVERQSTRLTCAAVMGAQTSYDPRFIKNNIGGRAHEHPALKPFYGLKDDELDTPKAHRLYQEASPINYVSADDPPVFLFYMEPNRPLAESSPAGSGIHHPNFGTALKKRLDPLKVECVIKHRTEYIKADKGVHDDIGAFLGRHFGLTKATSTPEKAAKPKP